MCHKLVRYIDQDILLAVINNSVSFVIFLIEFCYDLVLIFKIFAGLIKETFV